MSKNITIGEMVKNHIMLLKRVTSSKNEDELNDAADAVDEYAEGNGITSAQYKDLLDVIEHKELEFAGIF